MTQNRTPQPPLLIYNPLICKAYSGLNLIADMIFNVDFK